MALKLEKSASCPGQIRRLKNKPLSECPAHAAKKIAAAKEGAAFAAKYALQGWYESACRRADAIIPTLQIESNLAVVASMPRWQENKGIRNGYVMMCTLLDATPRPLILELDYNKKASGGLTYRQLHRQVRERLGLEPKVSLRMCPFRPWHLHIKRSFPIPEAHAIPATDAQCRHLLGTTVLYYTYVHLRD